MDFSPKNYFNSHKNLFEKIDRDSITNAIKIIKKKFLNQSTIITCGNGGSAHTASHFITDWNKMINLATNKIFKGICLCDNVGLITAYANDIEYNEIFSGQLKAILCPEDLVIAVSGSGNSKNVINAVKYANSVGADTLAFVGYDGGELIKVAKNSVMVPSFDMQLCEDIHLMLGHMVMKELCNAEIIS